MMNSHQGNQANSSSIGTYQYQIGDQVLEIPSNINYQLENIIAAGGGVSILLLFFITLVHFFRPIHTLEYIRFFFFFPLSLNVKRKKKSNNR